MSESIDSESSDSDQTGSSFWTEDHHRQNKNDNESDNEEEKLLTQSEYVLR